MRNVLVAVLLHLLAVPACAQYSFAERYNMTRLDLTAGLPHNYVNHIFVDSKGFVWVACYGGGAVRYDGYTFMSLRPETPDGSISHSCKGFAEDRHQRLWTAYDEGVVVTDLHTMRRTVPPDRQGNMRRLLAKESVRVYCDSQGALWHVTRDSIYRYTFAADGSIAHVSSLRCLGITPDVCIRDIDGNGTVWANIDEGLYRLCETGGRLERRELAPVMGQLRGMYVTDLLKRGNSVWIATNSGLYDYSLYDGSLRSYHPSSSTLHSLAHDYVTSLATTSDGRLLVGTLRGLCVLNDQTGSFSLWNTTTPDCPMPSDFIHCMLIYGQRLWIGTETAGVVCLTRNPLLLRNYVNELQNAASLSPHPVNAMYAAHDGSLWVGTVEGGLNRKEPNGGFQHWTTANSGLAHNTVSVLEGDDDKRLWIGTWGGGVHVLSLANPNSIHHISMPKGMERLTSHVGALAYDRRNDALWIGSNDGVFLYDLKTGQLEDPFEGNRYIHGCIGSHIDRQGMLWIGCLTGVCVVDLKSGSRKQGRYRFQSRNLRQKLDRPESPVVDKITCFCETRDGTLWLGSNGYGMYRRKVEGEGKKEVFEALTTADGLANNSVKGIAEDAQGRLWVTTNNGLSIYDPGTQTFVNYGEREGLLCQQFYWNSVVKSPDGAIYLGSIAGLTEVRGENNNAAVPAHLTFTQLFVDNQEVTAADDRDILDADVSQARRISLHESNKSFAISFSSLTFDGGVHGHYSYRLRGFEGDWTVLKPGEHSVRYTSLKPGTYTFELAYQVKPSDAPQVISIDIDVAPYFWKSWWFLLLSAFILVVVMIWQLRQRMEKLRQKEAEKLLVPIRKAIDDADDPEQLQIRIQNILDNHEHLKNSFRRTVEADKQEAMRTRKSFVERATDVMEQNYSNSEFGINEFAEALGMSTSLVSKRLKAETGQSTSQFIRNYRLTIGRKLLLENDANRNVTEIAYKVGFNDPKYFTRCFTHLFGVSPSAYAEGDVKEDAKVDEN